MYEKNVSIITSILPKRKKNQNFHATSKNDSSKRKAKIDKKKFIFVAGIGTFIGINDEKQKATKTIATWK